MSYDEKRFSDLIYDILRQSDLETVSAKKIRNALSERLGYDVSEHKVS
jgi:upstream activation factor subunit UAF30